MERLLRIYGYGLLSFFVTTLAISTLDILVLLIIPIFALVTIKYKKDVMMTLLVYSLLMIINFDLIVSLMYISSYAGFGMLVGYLVMVRQGVFPTIMKSTIYIFVSSLVTLFSAGVIIGKNPFDVINEAFIDNNAEALKSLNVNVVSILKESVIGIYFVFALLMSVILYHMIKTFVKSKYKEEMESIKFFRIEGLSFLQFILFLIVIIAFKLYDAQYGGYIFYGSIIALLSILLLQGFSVIYWFLIKHIKNKYVSLILAIYTAFIFISPLVGIIVGLNDLIYNFRKV